MGCNKKNNINDKYVPVCVFFFKSDTGNGHAWPKITSMQSQYLSVRKNETMTSMNKEGRLYDCI